MSKKLLFGKETERMPNIAFRMMALVFKIREFFINPEKTLGEFDIKKGQIVIDYGCGPGLHIKKASQMVGPEGKILAVDVHDLAIKAVNKKIKKEHLTNVEGIVTNGHDSTINNDTADIIYALDMFHMIKETHSFLKELCRIIKKDGFLFIENGHQTREKAKIKINSSGFWKIVLENKNHIKCVPIKG
jgi:ubiquinone/menaquinone biosynthesis C-methylase UbiE